MSSPHDPIAVDETSRLLPDTSQQPHLSALPLPQDAVPQPQPRPHDISAATVLPVALLSALAMAATAATSVFAYAFLLCKDPTHCRDAERNSYAGAVAIATTIANMCGVLVLGGLEKLSTKNHKGALLLWLVCRSMSVVALGGGVYLRNIIVALVGRVFEGLASDNLLHFNLNSIYVQDRDKSRTAQLIGISLALYMIGIAVGPFVAGLFANFETSFVMALAIFAGTVIYLCFFVPSKGHGKSSSPEAGIPQDSPNNANNNTSRETTPTTKQTSTSTSPWQLSKVILAPLQPFRERPTTSFFGLALFLYNGMQSYIFAAIMVHTTLHFGFTSTQNGYMISLAHSVAALYLLATMLVIPRLLRRLKKEKKPSSHDQQGQEQGQEQEQEEQQSSSDLTNASLAISSLLIQAASLGIITLATQPWHIYLAACLTALGLATPSFIKAYYVSLFAYGERPRALAALAMMEVLGSILAPIILGGSQTLWPGNEVFLLAGGLVGMAAVLFAIGVALGRREVAGRGAV